MMHPRVPIEVDPQTGVWNTGGLPRSTCPSFVVNNRRAIEAHLGGDTYRDILFSAESRSAFTWCQHAAETNGLAAWPAVELDCREVPWADSTDTGCFNYLESWASAKWQLKALFQLA